MTPRSPTAQPVVAIDKRHVGERRVVLHRLADGHRHVGGDDRGRLRAGDARRTGSTTATNQPNRTVDRSSPRLPATPCREDSLPTGDSNDSRPNPPIAAVDRGRGPGMTALRIVLANRIVRCGELDLRYYPPSPPLTAPATMNDVTSRVEQIAARAAALYSRPTVALEIVRLTSEPQVDPRVLKDLLEKDPALTCKVLRVVNSSFFGLRCEVADLNQALTVLGNKPLRLLVLGFSLPDELFAEMAAEQLAVVLADDADAGRRRPATRHRALARAGRRGVHRRLDARHRHPGAVARVGRALCKAARGSDPSSDPTWRRSNATASASITSS